MKHLIFFSFFLILFSACNHDAGRIIKISGEAQGTTYSISYFSKDETDYKNSIDSILKKIDSSLSTYLPASVISGINRNDSSVVADDHFKKVFAKAIEIAAKTGGAFDPTVAPVVNAWGFGFTKKENTDSLIIDSLLDFVGYKKVWLQENRLLKEKPGSMLDFNAIAQGYTVDVIASFLDSKGISSYFVELGGEVKAKGNKKNGQYWKVGIDKPDEAEAERTLQAIIELRNKALATSGNYRKFYVENGKKYAHIIDPSTGYPTKHNLLSATVVADDCMTADAFATAFMVMGFERAKNFLQRNSEFGLEVFFIYDEKGVWKTYTSKGLKKWMKELR